MKDDPPICQPISADSGRQQLPDVHGQCDGDADDRQKPSQGKEPLPCSIAGKRSDDPAQARSADGRPHGSGDDFTEFRRGRAGDGRLHSGIGV